MFGDGLYDNTRSGIRQRVVPRVAHTDMPCAGPPVRASLGLGHIRRGSSRHHTQPQAAMGTGPALVQSTLQGPGLVCWDLTGQSDRSQMQTSFSAAFEFPSQGSTYEGRTQVDIIMGSMRTSRSWECSDVMV